jgi:hypothetical protein
MDINYMSWDIPMKYHGLKDVKVIGEAVRVNGTRC